MGLNVIFEVSYFKFLKLTEDKIKNLKAYTNITANYALLLCTLSVKTNCT